MSSHSDFTRRRPGRAEFQLWAPSCHRAIKGAKSFAMKSRPDSAAAISSSSTIAFLNFLVLHYFFHLEGGSTQTLEERDNSLRALSVQGAIPGSIRSPSPSSRHQGCSKSSENQKNVTSSKQILFPKEPAASLNLPFQTFHWPHEKSGSHWIVLFQHFPKE